MITSNAPRAVIHLDAILRNFELVRSLVPNSKIMVVVKADAYGHGAARVCKHLSNADAFAVARVTEGIDLRADGIDKQIVVLEGFLDKQELQICRRQKLIPVVHSDYQLDMLDDLPVWIKINTGMNRLGFSVGQNQDKISLFTQKIRLKNVVGIMSHLANSELIDKPLNSSQIADFSRLLKTFASKAETAIANSGAILGLPALGLTATHFDWVRPGLMMYGGSPTGEFNHTLAAGMTLTAPVIAINQITAGDAIGYGSVWTAPESCRIAVVGLGYADGYPREIADGTPVLIDGKRRLIVGRISMDMCFVKLEHSDQVEIGDQVIFWGPGLPIDEIAQRAGTVSYTLMSGLTGRVQKTYGEK